jgi:hypothetical protein
MGRAGSIAYWAGAAVLMMFGFVAIFSIGAPFLLTGAAMVVVGPLRHRREVLWPALLAVWSFVVAYVLVAPLGCTGSSLPLVGTTDLAQQAGRTTCTNVLGIDYSGGGVYNPPLMPALLVGLSVAVIVALVARRAFRPGAHPDPAVRA